MTKRLVYIWALTMKEQNGDDVTTRQRYGTLRERERGGGEREERERLVDSQTDKQTGRGAEIKTEAAKER